ncbi:MAG: hypothetical protein QT04_C0047G0003 [archaeon GW2011_AR11]|nr:MAG: hypothetical protein QT04_C0047G0003 [archaeon GW2011_AR11]
MHLLPDALELLPVHQVYLVEDGDGRDIFLVALDDVNQLIGVYVVPEDDARVVEAEFLHDTLDGTLIQLGEPHGGADVDAAALLPDDFDDWLAPVEAEVGVIDFLLQDGQVIRMEDIHQQQHQVGALRAGQHFLAPPQPGSCS